MHPYNASGSAGAGCDIPDGDGGGIAREDRFRRNLGLYFRQYAALDREVLEYRLDDQIQPRESAVIGGAGEEAGQPLMLRTGQPASFQPLIENAERCFEPLPDPGQFRVFEACFDLGVEHRRPGDGGSHESRPNDAEPANPKWTYFGAGRNAIVLLESVRREED